MKKILTIILFAFIFLVGCEKVSTQPLKDIISGIQTVNYLDTVFDPEEHEGMSCLGFGSAIIVDKQLEEIGAVYPDDSRMVMIEIKYEKKLFSSIIKIDELTISYVDLFYKLYVEVNFWDGDNYAEYESLEALTTYLATLRVNDIRSVLLELGYLEKGQEPNPA